VLQGLEDEKARMGRSIAEMENDPEALNAAASGRTADGSRKVTPPLI
jgi:hypothetical protein